MEGETGLKIEAKGNFISVFQARRPKFPRRYLLYTLEFKGLGGKRLVGKRLGGKRLVGGGGGAKRLVTSLVIPPKNS